MILSLGAALLVLQGGSAFVWQQSLSRQCSSTFTCLHAGKGFGSKGSGKSFGDDKTYGKKLLESPLDGLIDPKLAMKEFFSTKEEWAELFRWMAEDRTVPAMAHLGEPFRGFDGSIFDASPDIPWKRLDAIPQEESHKQVISNFLDSMQQSLLNIPVNEKTDEDEHDVHFIEEGRRMLSISRFHVLEGNSGQTMMELEDLFATCWSELAHLRHADESNTGSLILLPDYNLQELRIFTDKNLQRPLKWLGVMEGGTFEVASMQRESPAIRLLHKVGDIPTPEKHNEDPSP